MTRLLPLMALMALMALGACASLSESECRGGDWRAIGFRDGAAGRLESVLGRHAEACAELGIRPDPTAWSEGRREGLALYCRPAKAYEIARRGGRLNPVCQGYDLRALAIAEAEGRRDYELEREIRRMEDDLREIDARIDDLLDDEVSDDERAAIRSYRREASFIRSRLRLLELERFTEARWLYP